MNPAGLYAEGGTPSAAEAGATGPSLRARGITAFLWGGGGTVVRLIVQVGAQIAMARILGPEQYGLFAVGAIVLSFSNFFSDLGFAYGLIQRPQVSPDDIRFVFTWQLILGTLTGGTLMLLAPMLAGFFGDVRIAAVISALAPLCLVQAATSVSLNLMQRAINYKAVQMAQVIGYVAGYVGVGIPLALSGAQVWALVWAWSIQALVSCGVLYAFARHPVAPKLIHRGGWGIARFGLNVLATNVVNWVVSNADRVVIARSAPAATVGLYTTSYSLMSTPASSVMGFVQPVMYAACSRVQGQTQPIREAYLTLSGVICLVLMPAYAFVAIVAGTFIQALYGSAWAGAAPLLTPLALAMPLYLLWNVTTPPMWTSGRVTDELKLQAPIAVLWIVSVLVAVQYSILAAAWTVFALSLVRWLVFTRMLKRILALESGAYWHAVRGGLVVSGIVACVAGAVDAAMALLDAGPPLVRLAASLFTSLAVVLLCVRSFGALINDRVMRLVLETAGRASQRLPCLIQLALNKRGAR